MRSSWLVVNNWYNNCKSLHNAVGIVFYYFIICLYLYGTLAIDLVVITKSLVTVAWYDHILRCMCNS